MRQLIVSTPVSEAAGVRDAAQEFEAKHCFELDSTVGEDKRTTLFLHLNNREVEPFLQRLEGTEADVTLHPRPIVTVHTPFEEIPDDLRDTQMRSPFEVFQEGIQSIGAVQGLLGTRSWEVSWSG